MVRLREHPRRRTAPRWTFPRALRRLRSLALLAARALHAGLVGRKAATGHDAHVGRAGEEAAAAYLRRQGYAIIARNARAPMGEVDILCRDAQRQPVIVEVKSRARQASSAPQSLGVAPEAAITARKRRKLLALARYLRAANRWTQPVRIDVIAVEWPPGHAEPAIRHHINAVRP